MYDVPWGNRVRLLRVLNGFSQEQVAATLSAPLGTYSQWENKGRTPRDQTSTDRLAELFSIDRQALMGQAKINGPLFWFPRQYELRQADLVRGLIREELPKLLDVSSATILNLNNEGSLYIINKNIVAVVSEDLESVFSKIIPDGMATHNTEVVLGVGPKVIMPWHIDTLASSGLLDAADYGPISRRLAILVAADQQRVVDWILAEQGAFAGIHDANERNNVAAEKIIQTYPKADRRLQNWLIHALSNPTSSAS